MISAAFRKSFTDKLSDFEVFWLTLYGEFRGEPVLAQVGGANVILNRARESGRSVKYICLKRAQFSCWNLDDPNFPKMVEAFSKPFPADNVVIARLKVIATEGLKANLADNTDNSNHYLATWLFNSPMCPRWAKDKNARHTVVIGKTQFLWCP